MDTFTEYITKENDRLDLICFAAYGDPFAWRQLLSLNRALPIQDLYPSGIRLVIPIVATPTDNVSTTLLPPWKRPVE